MSKSKWHTIQLYFSGDQYFRDALKDIHKAEKEILLESYIFDYDPIGIQVLEALSMARDRGVQVRLLVDGIGSFNWLTNIQQYCSEHHLRLYSYNSLPLAGLFIKNFSWRYFRRLMLFFRRINNRNHRKVILIDKKILYTGSFNISQVHSEKYMDHQAWRDSGVRVEHERLADLSHELTIAWKQSRKNFFRKRVFPFSMVRLNNTLYSRYKNRREIHKRIAIAQSRILITNAYFLPPASFLRALIKAARKGVFVGLCLPAKTDVKFVQWGSRSLYYRLMKAGVQIYEYQPRVLHAKSIIIDDWATIGSMNLNHRSFIHDLEIDVVLDQPETLKLMTEQWDKDVRQSRLINKKHLGLFPWWQRRLAHVAHWLRYWL